MKENATLKKIAAITGFSVITISRALNNPEAVKESTRNKILSVCKEMNYSPNMVAKSLKENKTRIISVFIPEDIQSRNPFYTVFVSSVAEALGNHKYSMFLSKTISPSLKCDGMILTSLSEKEMRTAKDIADNLPVVLFGHIKGIDSIDVDNKHGLNFMTSTVIKRGGKNIAYLSIDTDRIFVKDREDGFIEAASKSGVNYSIYKVKNNAFETYVYLKKHFKEFGKVDTLICASDDIALGAISYLQENGYSIPEDIQVCGFDGFGSENHSIPEIATMKQPIYEIGQLLVERLMDKIENDDHQNKTQLIKTSFIDNGSIKRE